MASSVARAVRRLLDEARSRIYQRLGTREFQARALGSPLLRPVARRRARALFDLCAGFTYSQVLSACVRLDLLEQVRNQARSVEALARATGVAEYRLQALVDAAVALKLLRRAPAGIGLGPAGAALLGNPGVLAMIRHHDLLYADLADPLRLLRDERAGTKLAAFWTYAGAADGASPDRSVSDAGAWALDYSGLMSASQTFIADEVIQAFPFARFSRVLDVGGGEGAFALALAERHAGLTVTVFDLPEVAARARQRFAESPAAARVAVRAGSFLDQRLPGGADLVTLLRILHDHDLPTVRRLLRRCFEALPPGGEILIAEPMAGRRGDGGVDAYFACYFLAMGQGRLRPPREIAGLLADAGFRDPRRHSVRLPMLVDLVSARREA